MGSQDWPLFRLRITADADPGAIARVLQPFQNLNVLPRKVVAEIASTGLVHLSVDVTGVPEDTIRMIAARISQVPCILDAHWCRA
jgi:hypothetical protein